MRCCITQNDSSDPSFECGVPRSALNVGRSTLSVGRFPCIFQRQYVVIPLFDPRHAPCHYIARR